MYSLRQKSTKFVPRYEEATTMETTATTDPSIVAMAAEEEDTMTSATTLVDEETVVAKERPPPRLMITKMVLENFKSYAGIKTIGPFHKCFSSVVGPNGSGKSNVIDAMLFVFGKKAKKLRLNKVSELIHSSDACAANPPQYTKVSVYLHEIIDTGDGDDDYDVVPNTSVIVSRVARVDNTSQYQIDGRNSTFKQVADYLGTRGIDLDNNRFLILQGEVEMISMMSPKGKTDGDEGLLEYLEDIIGSNKYVEAANIAAAKVEQLGEVRQERLHRVRAAEKEKDGLSSAKAEAEALVSKDREIRRKKNVLYQIYSMHARNEGDEAGTERTELLTNLNEYHTKLVEADNRVAEIENGMSDQKKEYDDVYAELTETKEAYTSYERQDIQMRENMKHEKTTIKKLNDKITGEMKKMEDAQSAMDDAETRIPILEEQITECTERRAAEDSKLEVILDETKSITETLRHELEAKSHELAPMQQERTVYQNLLDTAQMEVDLLEDGVSRALEQLNNAERELSELDGRQRDSRAKLKECETELSESKARMTKAEVDSEDLGPKETALAKKSIDLVTQVEIARSSMQQSATGLSRVASAIIKASKKGGDLANCGVMGRLGDLATIDEQYDVAVSTACGMLDHIVVQTTAGTQKCLEHLRKHNLGRASFVPLDKMKKGAFDRAVETPEGAPRLFDLICPGHAAIVPALYLAVGDTLVAPDLETATRWAYDFGKRWRVVTEDGKLIETSGTMSGGGNSAQKGKMKQSNDKTKGVASTTNVGGSDTSPEELKQLEEEARVAQDELKACRDRRRELTEEIRTLNKLIKAHSVKLPKLRMEIEGFDTTREVLTKQLPMLRDQSTLSAIDEAKKAELFKKVVKCKSEMSACVAATSKLEAEVAKLQKNIVTAGGTRLTNQQKACDKAKKDLNDASKELAAAKSTITNSKKIIIKAEKVKEMAEMDLQQSREALETIQAEHVGLEGQAKEVMEAYEQVKKDEAEKRQALALVLKECEKLKQAQQKLKCAEVELHAKIETLDKQVKDCEKKVMHWDREVEQLCKVEKQEEIDYDFTDDEDEGEEEGDDTIKPGGKRKEADAEEGDVDDKDSPNIDESKETKTNTSTNTSSLPKLADSFLDQYSMESVKSDIAILEKERDTLAKNANMGAIAEYRKKDADYLSRVTDLDQITSERNQARKEHEDLRRLRLEMFMNGFLHITLKLKEMYQMITLGGDAELELVDSLDPFSEGIVFSVRPPKKSWKNIANLSGGEKTLSSLALVFALHHYKPTPLYVMDEIDAALDFKNVSIVAHYIKERTKNAQFIIISLRNNMFELADRLVGIYKTNNCTNSVTINPRLYSRNGKESDEGIRKGNESDVGITTPFKDRTNADVVEAA